MLGPGADAASVSEPVADESYLVSILECAAFTRLIPREIFLDIGSSRSVSLLQLPLRARFRLGSSGASGAVANATGRERYSSMPSVAFQNWWNASPGSLCGVVGEQLPDMWNNGEEAYPLSQEHEGLVHRLLGLRQFVLQLWRGRGCGLRERRGDASTGPGSGGTSGFLWQGRILVLFFQLCNASLQVLAHLHMLVMQHAKGSLGLSRRMAKARRIERTSCMDGQAVSRREPNTERRAGKGAHFHHWMHLHMPGMPPRPCNALQQRVSGARARGSRPRLRRAGVPACTITRAYRHRHSRKGLSVNIVMVIGQQICLHRLTESPSVPFCGG